MRAGAGVIECNICKKEISVYHAKWTCQECEDVHICYECFNGRRGDHQHLGHVFKEFRDFWQTPGAEQKAKVELPVSLAHIERAQMLLGRANNQLLTVQTEDGRTRRQGAQTAIIAAVSALKTKHYTEELLEAAREHLVYSDYLRKEMWDLESQGATEGGTGDWRRRIWPKSLDRALVELSEAMTALEAEGRSDVKAALEEVIQGMQWDVQE